MKKTIITICIVFIVSFIIVQIAALNDNNYVNNVATISSSKIENVEPLKYNCPVCGTIYYKCSHLDTPLNRFDNPMELSRTSQVLNSIKDGTFDQLYSNKRNISVNCINEDETVRELKKLNNNIQKLKRYIEYGY
jgi:hypothetical protein